MEKKVEKVINIKKWIGCSISTLVYDAEGSSSLWLFMLPSWHSYFSWLGLQNEIMIISFICTSEVVLCLPYNNFYSSFISYCLLHIAAFIVLTQNIYILEARVMFIFLTLFLNDIFIISHFESQTVYSDIKFTYVELRKITHNWLLSTSSSSASSALQTGLDDHISPHPAISNSMYEFVYWCLLITYQKAIKNILLLSSSISVYILLKSFQLSLQVSLFFPHMTKKLWLHHSDVCCKLGLCLSFFHILITCFDCPKNCQHFPCKTFLRPQVMFFIAY